MADGWMDGGAAGALDTYLRFLTKRILEEKPY